MKNRYCVIMAGGVGSRLWPFSRTDRPKQFLDFLGTGRTLLQMTYDRFRPIIPTENIFIITNEIYADLVREQLPEIRTEQLLLEPQRRNTAPCIAWAAYHISTVNPQANIVVAPADHLILKESEFKNAIDKGLDFVDKYPALLTLGIKPNRPETGYGYIQVEDSSDEIKTAKTFTEKPSLELAKVFIESGEFFWNSGIFLWNVQTIIKAYQRYQPDIANCFEQKLSLLNTSEETAFINDSFASCPNISIDFGIMEKASNVFVLCSDFGWSDLGSWDSLYDRTTDDEQHNVTFNCETLMYESQNNLIATSAHKLVVLQGLNDYIVVEDGNVLLICKREEEQRIRQFVTDAKIQFGNKYI